MDEGTKKERKNIYMWHKKNLTQLNSAYTYSARYTQRPSLVKDANKNKIRNNTGTAEKNGVHKAAGGNHIRIYTHKHARAHTHTHKAQHVSQTADLCPAAAN